MYIMCQRIDIVIIWYCDNATPNAHVLTAALMSSIELGGVLVHDTQQIRTAKDVYRIESKTPLVS